MVLRDLLTQHSAILNQNRIVPRKSNISLNYTANCRKGLVSSSANRIMSQYKIVNLSHRSWAATRRAMDPRAILPAHTGPATCASPGRRATLAD